MRDIKEMFPGFYREKLNEVLSSKNSDKTLYIFDTNYFLDIYELEFPVAIKFIEAIEKIGENIFIPFQVGLEFHMNKKNVIIGRQKNRENFENHIRNTLKEIEGTGSLNFQEKDAFLDQINQKILNLKEELSKDIDKKYKENTEGHVDIEERILNIFGKHIGTEPSAEEEKIYLEKASERFKNKQPPGYDDSHKDGFYYDGRMRQRKYGDLLIWKETLNYLKDKDEIKYVIFVTNDGTSDKKSDLRHRVHDENYDVHISLVSEMYYENQKVLYLMTNDEFIGCKVGLSTADKNRISGIAWRNDENPFNQIEELNKKIADLIKSNYIQELSKTLSDSFDLSGISQISNSIDFNEIGRLSEQISRDLRGIDNKP